MADIIQENLERQKEEAKLVSKFVSEEDDIEIEEPDDVDEFQQPVE